MCCVGYDRISFSCTLKHDNFCGARLGFGRDWNGGCNMAATRRAGPKPKKPVLPLLLTCLVIDTLRESDPAFEESSRGFASEVGLYSSLCDTEDEKVLDKGSKSNDRDSYRSTSSDVANLVFYIRKAVGDKFWNSMMHVRVHFWRVLHTCTFGMNNLSSVTCACFRILNMRL